MNAKWSVLAVYEDADARQSAVQFCDCLVQRFWLDFGFDLAWSDWAALEDSASAKEASDGAARANLIIMAPGRRGSMPMHVKSWLEFSLKNRGDREGVLVGLPGAEPECGAGTAAATQAYLRKLAHEAGLDYLDAVPECLPAGVPDSADACNQRATQVTSVLDSILRYSPLPPPAP
jgi:hypothetical protein